MLSAATPLENTEKFLADVEKAISVCSSNLRTYKISFFLLRCIAVPLFPCFLLKQAWEVVAKDNEVTNKEALFAICLCALAYLGVSTGSGYALNSDAKILDGMKLTLLKNYVIPHLDRLTYCSYIPASLFEMRNINVEKISFTELLTSLNQAKETLEQIIKTQMSDQQRAAREKQSLSSWRQVWNAATHQASNLCCWRKKEEKHSIPSPRPSTGV